MNNKVNSLEYINLVGKKAELNKPLFSSTKSIFGLGFGLSKYLIGRLGILPTVKNNLLEELDVAKLNEIFELQDIENKVRVKVSDSIDVLKKQGSVRGLRLRQGLPCRGQRTHTNAQSAKRIASKQSR